MTVGFLNPAIFEVLPNACLSPTARDVFDVLTARQEPGGAVYIWQKDVAARLGVPGPAVSRAVRQLRDKGILEGRQRRGFVLIHPLLAGYESPAHMINHVRAPDTYLWPLHFPAGDIRPPRSSDVRAGTGFDPGPGGGEDAPVPEARPVLRLLAS